FRAHRLADDRGERQNARRTQLIQAPVGSLRLDNGVKIAAIRDIDDQRSKTGRIDLDRLLRQITRDIANAHALHANALFTIIELDLPGRHIGDEASWRPRLDQTVLDPKRDDADRAVAAHRQAAARLYEQDARIGVGMRRRIEEAPAHHVVAARFEA